MEGFGSTLCPSFSGFRRHQQKAVPEDFRIEGGFKFGRTASVRTPSGWIEVAVRMTSSIKEGMVSEIL